MLIASKLTIDLSDIDFTIFASLYACSAALPVDEIKQKLIINY